MAVEAVVGATIIAAIHGSRASHAGNFSNIMYRLRFEGVPAGCEKRIGGIYA